MKIILFHPESDSYLYAHSEDEKETLIADAVGTGNELVDVTGQTHHEMLAEAKLGPFAEDENLEKEITLVAAAEAAPEEVRIDLADGKYTYIFSDDGKQRALRYGEPWRDLTGDNLIYWMAQRIVDLRTQLTPVSEQPAFPERDPSKPAEHQGMFRKFDVRRVDGSDQPGGKHHGCRYFVLDLDHDPAAPAGMRGYAAEIRATHPKLADDIEAEFGEQPAAQTFCASCHTVVRCAESGECDHHGYKLQIAEGGGNE